MKIGKSDGPERSGKAAATYAKAAEAASARPATPMAQNAATASILGIPEAEFTPRVRDAIMGLMQEVDRLRHEVEQTRAKLEDVARAADQDMLLPILNRRAFVREITRFISLAKRYGTPSSVIYFDLDDFKAVNDTYGHAGGDAVLQHFAELLGGQIRDTDILARLGGDEFGVLLTHVGIEQARKKAASLEEILRRKPPVWEGQSIALKFSCGAYELAADETADTAIAQADRQMYAQKRSSPKSV